MMTSTTTAGFTPGPWREHSHRQIGPAGGIVCEVWSAIGTSSDDAIAQADANCLLIAAAPELHQALVEVLGDYRDDMAKLRRRTLKLAVAALAKANGGAA